MVLPRTLARSVPKEARNLAVEQRHRLLDSHRIKRDPSNLREQRLGPFPYRFSQRIDLGFGCHQIRRWS